MRLNNNILISHKIGYLQNLKSCAKLSVKQFYCRCPTSGFLKLCTLTDNFDDFLDTTTQNITQLERFLKDFMLLVSFYIFKGHRNR